MSADAAPPGANATACADCGAPMNEGEAKCFTVCDACWDSFRKTWSKHYPGRLDALTPAAFATTGGERTTAMASATAAQSVSRSCNLAGCDGRCGICTPADAASPGGAPPDAILATARRVLGWKNVVVCGRSDCCGCDPARPQGFACEVAPRVPLVDLLAAPSLADARPDTLEAALVGWRAALEFAATCAEGMRDPWRPTRAIAEWLLDLRELHEDVLDHESVVAALRPPETRSET